MEYQNFVKFIKDSMFNFSAIKMLEIKSLYEEYNATISDMEDELKDKSDFIFDTYDMLKETEDFNDIELIFMEDLLWETFGKKRIDNDGYCLKANLIGHAVELNNTDLFGIVSNIANNKHLFIDFGDKEPVKTRLDELRIVGQKKL